MNKKHVLVAVLLVSISCVVEASGADNKKATGLQLAENPPMEVITRTPPARPGDDWKFEMHRGFSIITSLDELRAAIKKDGQKIRMAPGVYRAKKTDPPVDRQQHIFAVTGSNNYFDLRGVVIETPVSVQSKLSGRAHVSDTWRVNGSNNTFAGGYFLNVTDRQYDKYRITENEFEIRGDGNSFINCIFVIKGSVPYGY